MLKAEMTTFGQDFWFFKPFRMTVLTQGLNSYLHPSLALV